MVNYPISYLTALLNDVLGRKLLSALHELNTIPVSSPALAPTRVNASSKSPPS